MIKVRKHLVLFVDDDTLILEGIRRSVEEYSDVWNVDFALSGKDALTKLDQQPFDAVITDMHMPGMDGLQLLGIVSTKMPGVMRFVLSGNTSDVQGLRSTHLVHQMIPKPCDIEQIFAIVERACLLRDMLADPRLHRIIIGIKTLPSVPLLYNQLLKELESEKTSSQSIGNIIAQDTAMTAKILQLVNSAFFGLYDNVTSPQRAVTILGLNTIKALVLVIHIFSKYQGRTNLPITIDGLWKHSMMVSSLAYTIAGRLKLGTTEQENARVSGILHDIGKLLQLKIPDYLHLIRLDKKGMIPIESEYQVLGTSHAEMGAYLLGMWGLPSPIVEAVTFHHKPGIQVSEKASLLTALHTANGLLNMWKVEKKVIYEGYLDIDYLEKVSVIMFLDEWTALARDLVTAAN